MVKYFRSKVRGSTFIRDTMLLSAATAVAQLVSILISPVLSRLYTPQDFGDLGRIVAYTSIIAGISSLKYDMAIILSKSAFETRSLIKWSHLFILFFSLFAVPVYMLLYQELQLTVLLIIFLLVYLNSFLNLLTGIFTRFKKFNKIARIKVTNKFSGSAIQVFFGLIGFGYIGLALGQIIGLLSSFIFTELKSNKSIINIFYVNKKEFKEAKPILLEHYRFPLYTAPQNLLNSLSQNAPILLLEGFFGNTVVGLYWFSLRIIQLPIAFISNSFRQTFLQKASVTSTKKDLKRLHKKSTRTLLALGLPFTLLGMFFLPYIFELIFGSEWKEAGVYAKWLLPWVLSLFINPPSTSLIPILNLQKFNLVYDILLLIFRVLVVTLGGYFLNVTSTIILFSFIGVFFNGFLIFYINKKLSNSNE